jgi:hypothetical protein
MEEDPPTTNKRKTIPVPVPEPFMEEDPPSRNRRN